MSAGIQEAQPALAPRPTEALLWDWRNSRPLAVLGLALIPFVGLGDYLTGTEISFAVFYVPPLAMAGWFGGRTFACIAGVESAIVWFAADAAGISQLTHPAIHYWNTVVRIIVYTLLAVLLALLRERRDELELAVQRKTALLRKEIAERARVEREILEICNREQRRIAYDLHDGLGQQLVAAALKAKLLQEKLNGTPAAHEAAGIVSLINDAARQTRLTARNLDSSEIVGDLNAALQALAASVKSSSRAPDAVKDSAPVPVSTPVAVQLYRIAQEAVRNAIEHGGASEVQIDLSSDGKDIVLRIGDNGAGFDPASVTQGMGLRIMQYRAHCVDGWCNVESCPTRGTTVSCRVPFSQSSRAAA